MARTLRARSVLTCTIMLELGLRGSGNQGPTIGRGGVRGYAWTRARADH